MEVREDIPYRRKSDNQTMTHEVPCLVLVPEPLSMSVGTSGSMGGMGEVIILAKTSIVRIETEVERWSA